MKQSKISLKELNNIWKYILLTITQAYTNVTQSQLQLKQHEPLAICMNIIENHTKYVDKIDEVLKEVTNLSNLCFYQKYIQDSFQVYCICLQFNPLDHRANWARYCLEYRLTSLWQSIVIINCSLRSIPVQSGTVETLWMNSRHNSQ